MSRQLIRIINSSIINPTMKYPLTSTCFNDSQIYSIHKRINPTVIADMGYSSKCPKVTRYGNHKYCSIKIQHYETEKILQKIDIIHRFINYKDFKHLATNMIESFQLVSGISTSVLENKKWEIKYVNSTLATSLV